MRVWSKTTLKGLAVPGAVLLAGVSVLVYAGWLTLALPAVNFLYYCAVAGGMLLAWRFHSSRIFLSLVVLFLACQVVSLFAEGQWPLRLQAVRVMAVLVPVDFVLIALMQERGFTAESMTPAGVLLFVQGVIVAVVCRDGGADPALAVRARHAITAISLPGYALVVLTGAGLFLAVRFLLTRKPLDSALLWSLAGFSLALEFTGNMRVSTLYAATSAAILAASIVENSYLLAYHDELTTLPSRRALNEALLRLQDPYSIAVLDIDHFKNFNDTYGHDTGDQVLRLVAAKLARVTGGGQAFRCGGEEFTILFPGKTTSQVVEHLEQLRGAIESSEFHMRGGERRQAPRGPERRRGKARGRARKGQAIRELAREQTAGGLSVTVSIGVATSAGQHADTESVLLAADKALYRAKGNGRNRVETASQRRTRVRAAGIA